MQLLDWLGGAAAQINPFDNGEDFNSYMKKRQQPQQQTRPQAPRQTPRPPQVGVNAVRPLSTQQSLPKVSQAQISQKSVANQFNPLKTVGDVAGGIGKGINDVATAVGGFVLPGTAKLTNQTLGIVENTGANIAGETQKLFGDKKGGQNTIDSVKRHVDQNLLAQGKGLFGQGGIYNSTDSLHNANPTEVLRKAGGTGLEVVGEKLPIVRVAKGPTLGAKIVNNAIAGAVGNTLANVGSQYVQNGTINPWQTAQSATIGGAFGGAIPLVGVAVKPVGTKLVQTGQRAQNFGLLPPTKLTPEELFAAKKMRQAQAGVIDPHTVTEIDAILNMRAENKLGQQVGTPQAWQEVNKALDAHRAFDVEVNNRRMAAQEALQNANQFTREHLVPGGTLDAPLGKKNKELNATQPTVAPKGAPIEKTPQVGKPDPTAALKQEALKYKTAEEEITAIQRRANSSRNGKLTISEEKRIAELQSPTSKLITIDRKADDGKALAEFMSESHKNIPKGSDVEIKYQPTGTQNVITIKGKVKSTYGGRLRNDVNTMTYKGETQEFNNFSAEGRTIVTDEQGNNHIINNMDMRSIDLYDQSKSAPVAQPKPQAPQPTAPVQKPKPVDPTAALKQEAPQGTFYKGFKKDGSSTASSEGDAFYITPHENIAKTYDEGVGVKQYKFSPDTKVVDWKSPEYKAVQEKHMVQVKGGEPGYRKPDYNAINAELKAQGYDAITFKTPDGDSPQVAVINQKKVIEIKNQPGVHDSLADNLPNQTGIKNQADNVFSLTQQSPESRGIIPQKPQLTDLYNQAHAKPKIYADNYTGPLEIPSSNRRTIDSYSTPKPVTEYKVGERVSNATSQGGTVDGTIVKTPDFSKDLRYKGNHFEVKLSDGTIIKTDGAGFDNPTTPSKSYTEPKKMTAEVKPLETPLEKSNRLHNERLAKNNLTQNQYADMHDSVAQLDRAQNAAHKQASEALANAERDSSGKLTKKGQAQAKAGIDAWSKAQEDYLIALNKVRAVDGQPPLNNTGSPVKAKTSFEQNTGVTAPTRAKATSEAVSKLEAEYNASKQALDSNPAAELMKYANKRTMELPEVTSTGKPTVFGKRGDQIVTELGFKDSEQARAEFEKYAMQREIHKNLADRFKEAKTAVRLSERENKADLTNLLNTPEAKGMTPIVTPDAPTSQSAFGKSLKNKGYDIEIPGYQRLANEDVVAQAEKSIATDERGVINSLLSRNQRVAPSTLENAQSVSLLSKLVREGRDEEALAIAKATATSSREAGRAVQILSKLEAITPEGATVRAQRIIQEYNDKMSRKAKELVLTEDNYKAIKGLAEEAQSAEVGTRARDLAEGKLLKYIEDLVPASAAKKLSSVQTMAQLLNPKTAIRNILGNVAGSVAEDISTAPAAVVDRIVSGIKGNGRSVAVANPFVKAQGMKTGLKYGIEDVNLGIKTSGITGKFDVQPDVFKKGIMKKLQTVLGYELGAPDKAFYQGQFDSTLDSLMRARKVTKPTLDMVEIANGEALYATFQNNSKLAGSLSKVKGVLNGGKEWGMGDIVLKYPKTPGNIVSVGLDYSPYGILKGAAQLYKNWEKLPLDAQREAVRNIGRGVTGTGAIALGYTLANNGIITGKPNADKDMAKLEREAGQGPFSFNMTALGRFLKGGDTKTQAGDTVMNYDWIQPAAIALSMGANMKINDKSATDGINAAWESLASGVDTITDQPVLKGVGDFARTSFQPREQGGGVDKAIANAVAGAPASFVPSSVNQVGQLTDPTARETRGPNFGKQVLDTVNARIPGLRTGLPASKTSLGEDRTTYDKGKNNLFNVFLNPAFVKTYKDNEVVNLVRDINDRSGETQQVPRTADRSIKINGEQVKLQPTEYSKYQEYIGKKTNDQFGKLSQDPKFMALSDEDKAKKMSNVMSDINTAAKIELFGNKPKTVESNVKKLLKGKDITAISGSTEAKTNKEKYEQALEKFNDPDNGYSKVEKVKKTEELKRLTVQKDYDEDTTMLHGMSKEDVWGFLSTYEDGKAAADKLLALDDALTAAGVQDKNKFRDKYGNIAIKPKEKSSGKGGSKAKTVKGQAEAVSSERKLRALLANTNNKTSYRKPATQSAKVGLKKFAVKSAGITSRKGA